ncbi:hypothetical protein [Desulfovibrio fairfieldensis]|uniref:Morphogenetic protein n=1 Tax=Desulfovibrio fairfieldensis TaxID=44742 RepID=A0A0X8JJW3_9BACT|nr:hypothetical protein [Desulfovibrio fairfieldensis]AMD90017.1 hypothetical protein AXF13_07745 [Desulfovibrio fairfieldensis]
MKESPIPFKGDMVRAILAGQKTQTRQTVVPPTRTRGNHGSICPYGQPGDRLWVKETFYRYYPSETWPEPKALYRADGITLCDKDSEGKKQRWTPSSHMPRILSRITLEITDIRVERVQDISEEDVQAEGFSDRPASKNKFRIAWDLLYWKRGLGWSVNPRVWVITFKRVENRNE